MEDEAVAFDLIGDIGVVGRASLLKRAAAGLVDLFLVLTFIVWPSMTAVGFASKAGLDDPPRLGGIGDPEAYFLRHPGLYEAIGRGLLLSGALVLAYFTITEGLLGQSVGKALLGIGVVAEDTGRLGMSAAMGRNLLKGLVPMTMGGVLGPVAAFALVLDTASLVFARRNQRYLERLVGSVCVEGYVLERSGRAQRPREGAAGEYIAFKGGERA